MDPLADADACKRDVPLLQELRTNIIRTYAIDPTKDHTECMRLLDEAGIYVISDLSSPGLSINRDEPTWTEELYARYTAVVDELAQYSNVVGFFAGNEVSNAPNNTQASAFVKAAVRDTKAHIQQRNYREMGVGYATNDDEDIRRDMADYFCCDSRESSIDFWGYNVYSWCGSSDYEESGYKDRTEEFADYPVPVFFAEYGCNDPEPRKFEDVEALYGDEMTKVWSGGIIYMYFEETNRYGRCFRFCNPWPPPPLSSLCLTHRGLVMLTGCQALSRLTVMMWRNCRISPRSRVRWLRSPRPAFRWTITTRPTRKRGTARRRATDGTPRRCCRRRRTVRPATASSGT